MLTPPGLRTSHLIKNFSTRFRVQESEPKSDCTGERRFHLELKVSLVSKSGSREDWMYKEEMSVRNVGRSLNWPT